MVKKTKEQIDKIDRLETSVYSSLSWIGIYIGTLLLTLIWCLIFNEDFKTQFFRLSACMFVSCVAWLIIDLIRLYNLKE